MLNFRTKLQKLIVNLFSSLAGSAILYPSRTLVLAVVATLLAAPGVLRLKLRTDGHALVPPSAPEVVYDKEIRDQFGIEDRLVVLIRSPHADGIFNPQTLQLVRELTADAQRLPGINPSNVMSLATEPSFRTRRASLVHQTMLEPPLRTAQELQQLREDLHGIQLYNGTFVSADAKSTVILVGIPSGADRTAIYRKALDIIAAKQPLPEDVAVTGAPVAESLLGLHILEDLGVPKALLGASTRTTAQEASRQTTSNFGKVRLILARRLGLVPLAALVMMVILLLSFRNVLAMLVPLPGLAATLLFVFGLMGWFGIPIYLTIAVMPVLLTATGVTNDIYVFSRYFSLLRERPRAGQVDLLRETFDKMASPVANTSLTTSAGFFSFAFSPLGPVRAFGICAGIGVLFGLACSFTVLPALLRLAKPEWFLRRRERMVATGEARDESQGQWRSAGYPVRSSTGAPQVPEKPGTVEPSNIAADWKVRAAEQRTPRSSALAGWFGRFGEWVVRRRGWVAAAALALTAITPLGLRRLVVQDSWTDGFAPDSEFSRATRSVNEQFYGMHLLFVSFDMPRSLKGEVPASAVTGDGIAFPAKLVGNPALIAGSAIAISAVNPSEIGGASNSQSKALQPKAGDAARSAPVPGRSNVELSFRPASPGAPARSVAAAPGDGRTPPPGTQALPSSNTVWRSHIEMVYGLGTNLAARIPRREMPTEVWQSFAQSRGVRFEVVIRNHVRPEVIRAIGELADFIRERRRFAVGGVLSPADYLSTTRFMSRPNDPAARVLPPDPAEIKLMWDFYGIALGQDRLHQIVDTNYWRSLTTVFLKDANFQDTARLMTDLRQYERERLARLGIKIGFAGDVAVSQSLIQGIVTTQLQSLFWSLLGIYLITSVLGGSWRWGLYCLLPSALAVLIKLAVMGWCGIPLGVATSMFAAMTLGIGVNCAIQLLESYGQARADGASLPQALNRAFVLTGPPALVNTVAVSLGFGVLMLSQVPANARLGLLLVVGLVNCFIASLLLLPLLLHWWPLKSETGRSSSPAARAT